jgi:putative heme-binding domain-containing protein
MIRLCIAVWLSSPTLLAADAPDLFRAHCAPCHGPNGDGGRGANLAVRHLVHAPDDEALSAIIRDGIPGTQMPGTCMTAEESRALVAYVRALGQKPAARVEGDPARGESLFWEKGRCGRCHTIGARGGRLGPDLTAIGARRSPTHLRQSIVDPEEEVPETFAVYRRFITMPDAFLVVRVITGDGKLITGVRMNEDTFTIQIRDYEDRIWSFGKAELKELHKDWGKSPMPSYHGTFTEAELQDVVAYLAAQLGQAIFWVVCPGGSR